MSLGGTLAPWARAILRERRKTARARNSSFSCLRLPKRSVHSSSRFDYNSEYFKDTKIYLQEDPLTGNRSLFAKQPIVANEVILSTPYYNHVVHHHKQDAFCNACHDSLQLAGTSIQSKYIPEHKYCSEACVARGEPIDQEMEPTLRMIGQLDPSFLYKRMAQVKVVLFTLARRKIEIEGRATFTSADDDVEPPRRWKRYSIAKENSLVYSDFGRLCQLDLSSESNFLASEIRTPLLEVDTRLKSLIPNSPLMSLGITPLEILARNAANAFAVDKYDRVDEARALRFGLCDSSGEATFPLASYFNHSCFPNCRFSLDMSANIVVSTSRAVPADTELTISYDAMRIQSTAEDLEKAVSDTRHRCKSVCKSTWGFDCNCSL